MSFISQDLYSLESPLGVGLFCVPSHRALAGAGSFLGLLRMQARAPALKDGRVRGPEYGAGGSRVQTWEVGS